MNIGKTKESIGQRLADSRVVPWLLLLGVTVIFTLILYPDLVAKRRYVYSLGDVAEKNIKAPRDFFIEDEEATLENRKRAAEEVLTVYDHDISLLNKIFQRVQQSFSDIRAVVESADTPSVDLVDANADNPREILSLNERIRLQKGAFEEKLGIPVSKGAYKILENENFSKEISDLIIRILTEILENGVVANKEILLRESDKGIILRRIGTKTERVVTNLRAFYGLDQAKTMVRIVGQPLLKDLNYTLVNLIVDFSQRLLQPNITLNKNETEERRLYVISQVKPVLYKIKAGEMLLREGERVTPVMLLKLRAMEEQIDEGEILVSSAGTAVLIFCLLIITYIIHISGPAEMKRPSNKNLLFISSVLCTFFLLATIAASLAESLTANTPFAMSPASLYLGIPLSAGAMTVCVFLGIETAIPVAVVLAIGAAIFFGNRFEIFIYFMLTSSMAAHWMRHCRERKVFIKAGLKLGLLNVALATCIAIYKTELSGIKLLWDWAFAFLGGVGAGVITAGLAPMVEIAFGFTTDISLLELANLEKPILRKLMIEAPGTYHHSVVVGSMVEAAAAEIGANPLLSKVCGYYHDIGKIKKPIYFIENQTDGKNRHDKLAPAMSKRILISHVKDGVEIARKYKLGPVIIDTIKQSHGTSLISYFYEKAKQINGEDAVKADDYRYPGPLPQTREAGLVMLADVVEAASRTLDNPTPSRIQGLVQKLINKVFSDGQLDNCELTLRDLHNIAKSFNKILNGIHHHRIEYPEKGAWSNGKGKDGSSNRQPAKHISDFNGQNRETGASHLRRLGQS